MIYETSLISKNKEFVVINTKQNLDARRASADPHNVPKCYTREQQHTRHKQSYRLAPGSTCSLARLLYVKKSVSNVKPALMVRSPVAVLRGVSPGLVRSRVGGASHKQNSRNSKHDFPAHDQLLCSVAILVCSTYATPLHIRCELDHAGVPCRTRDDLSQ